MAHEPEYRRILLIGLGGSGQLILMHVKRLFLDTYGVVPPSVKLLSLDTDSARIAMRSAVSQEQYTLDPQEYLHLRVEQPREFIEAGGAVKKWYVKPVPVGAIENGTGAIRQNGRLAFFAHVDEFRRRVDRISTALFDVGLLSLMNNARRELGAKTDFRLSEKDAEVYVCGSLAGGTGSGTFLDVGIFLRHALPKALIHGFFLLDWVYRHKAFAHRIQGNVYAALAELDNLQSIMYGSADFVPYSVTYADETITVHDAPYNLVHLIDGRNEHGQNIDSVDDLCETVAHAIWLSTGSMAYKVSSVVDNLLAHISVGSPRLWKGKYHRYSSLGVSSLYYPADEFHRLLTAQNARDLCVAARREVEAGSDDSGPVNEDRERQVRDLSVERLFVKLELDRQRIRRKLLPGSGDIDLEVERYELSDVDAIEDKQREAEEDVGRQCEQAFEKQGRAFQDQIKEEIRSTMTEIERARTLDTPFLREWTDDAIDRFTALHDEAAAELRQCSDQVEQHRKRAATQLDLTRNSFLIPGIGGPRQRRARDWVEAADDLMEALRREKSLELERRFHEDMIATLKAAGPTVVPTPSEIVQALDHALGELRAAAIEEQENFKLLKGKRTQVLIGNGTTVVVPGDDDSLEGRQTIDLSYDEFRTESKINSNEEYLRRFQEDPASLVALFRDYAARKLAPIKDITIDGAMETLGRDKKGYVQEQLDHLFRLSSSLWKFNRGQINEVQGLQYDRIINIGVFDQSEGAQAYERYLDDIKPKYSIKADHAFSTTGDPQRIWLLSFSAALPAYVLSDLRRKKQKYEEEITPSYHIDSYFEMNVPDLFPPDEYDNVALRILGMAIVSGIDVVHDEFLKPTGGRGHLFTCDHELVKAIYHGEARQWRHFSDMYDEVRSHARLRKTLSQLLTDRVDAMSESERREAIQAHIDRVGEKLKSRNFSKLSSARITYREIAELKRFLDRQGYGMDIARYISGG